MPLTNQVQPTLKGGWHVWSTGTIVSHWISYRFRGCAVLGGYAVFGRDAGGLAGYQFSARPAGAIRRRVIDRASRPARCRRPRGHGFDSFSASPPPLPWPRRAATPETARGQAGLAGAGATLIRASGEAGCAGRRLPASATTAAGRLSRRSAEPFWFRGDYLMWWTNGTHLPPLVTTGDERCVAPSHDSVWGPDRRTRQPIGLPHAPRASGSTPASAGTWSSITSRWAKTRPTSAPAPTPTETRLLARPIYNVSTLQESRELVSSPVTPSPTAIAPLTVNAHDYFQSAGVLLSRNLYCCHSCGGSCDCCGRRRLRLAADWLPACGRRRLARRSVAASIFSAATATTISATASRSMKTC